MDETTNSARVQTNGRNDWMGRLKMIGNNGSLDLDSQICVRIQELQP
jgi:hypothetical protein